MQTFFRRVYALVSAIPPGYVMGYGDVARALGSPRAARQVGWAMRACPEGIPWHRVLRADGTISYGLHPELQRALLAQEGVVFLPDGRVDMRTCRWNG